MMKYIYSNKQVAVQRQPSDSKMMEKNPYSSLFIGFILCGFASAERKHRKTILSQKTVKTSPMLRRV